MGPSAQRSKDRQDEARREQQADEKVRELRRKLQEVQKRRFLFGKRLQALDSPEQLAEGLTEQEKGFRAALRFVCNKLDNALDGGGGKNE